MNKNWRNKCCISGSELELLEEIPFPIFCGCTDAKREEDCVLPQKFAISKEGVIQLVEMVPLEILYQQGHDAGSVGALWERHHEEFAQFIAKFAPNSVLEIGGGHGKLSQYYLLNQKISWTICEPNTQKKYPNVCYIDSFFHPEVLVREQYDCIVHSHTFEHIYNPKEFLSEIRSAFEESRARKKLMIFSLPNMQKWLENKFTNCLNFEHTIYLTENVIEYLLHSNNFEIMSKHYFDDHSIFYCTKAIDDNKNPAVLKNEYDTNKKLFLSMQEFYSQKIEALNSKIKASTCQIYLFGAHLFSQYLIYHGLDTSKIIGILDNNPSKQGKRLYGTDLFVQSPQILSDVRGGGGISDIKCRCL